MWGFSPEESAHIAFKQRKTRERLFTKMQNRPTVCFVNVTGSHHSAPEERQTIVGYAVLAPERLDSWEALDPALYHSKFDDKNNVPHKIGEYWVYGLRIQKAFRFNRPISMSEATTFGVPETYRQGATSFVEVEIESARQLSKFPLHQRDLYIPAGTEIRSVLGSRPPHAIPQGDLYREAYQLDPWRHVYIFQFQGVKTQEEQMAFNLLRRRHAPEYSGKLTLVKVGATKDAEERRRVINGQDGWAAFGVEFTFACNPYDHGSPDRVAQVEDIVKKLAHQVGFHVCGEYWLIPEGDLPCLVQAARPRTT